MTKNAGMEGIADSWADGKSYEGYVGRWSRSVAREFLAWLSVPSEQRWLDIGCGTGALTDSILQSSIPMSVTGIDTSEGYIAFARRQVRDARAEFQVGSAEELELPDESFDAAVSGLAINFMPHPDRAVAEMRRVIVPGGVVAAYVWDYAGDMEFMRYFWDAAISLDPGAEALDEGRRFPLCAPDPLKQLFKAVGLNKVETRSIDVTTVFQNFDDYWSPFLGGQGPAPSYAMSLPTERRNDLREALLERLPVSGDGSIHLIARAWAVKGEKA
jgi:SAM-dependent methyltransferase